MDLATAPSPKNKAIQLKELPSHRAIARYLHGHLGPLKVAGSAAAHPWPPGAGAPRTLAALLRTRDEPRSLIGPNARHAQGREPRTDVADSA